ncbi:hypothetical protein EXN66_Car005830 [Channa argus]|uniref:Uncharacterized protein n=1 Tax=Channa argus TaxID=215402 RepID=A0A6G1PJJ2_CHAAH|nr:hypothetical protein EXN66_Car005830 [Channa argus]
MPAFKDRLPFWHQTLSQRIVIYILTNLMPVKAFWCENLPRDDAVLNPAFP